MGDRLSSADRTRFSAKANREYRLRRQTPPELVRWPAPPHDGLAGWCIIRRSDGAVELFALVEGETWCDCDGCLRDLFADLSRNEAA